MKDEHSTVVDSQDEYTNISAQDNEDMLRMGKIQQFRVYTHRSSFCEGY